MSEDCTTSRPPVQFLLESKYNMINPRWQFTHKYFTTEMNKMSTTIYIHYAKSLRRLCNLRSLIFKSPHSIHEFLKNKDSEHVERFCGMQKTISVSMENNNSSKGIISTVQAFFLATRFWWQVRVQLPKNWVLKKFGGVLKKFIILKFFNTKFFKFWA